LSPTKRACALLWFSLHAKQTTLLPNVLNSRLYAINCWKNEQPVLTKHTEVAEFGRPWKVRREKEKGQPPLGRGAVWGLRDWITAVESGPAY